MSTAVYDRLDVVEDAPVTTTSRPAATLAPEPSATSLGIRAGLRDMAPMTVAIAPFAMVLGVAIGASVVPNVVGAVMAPVLYAGSANFAAIAVLDAGGTAITAALTAIVVNIRFMMYGAALAGRFADQPRWFRWLGPWFIIDQLFALASSRDERDPVWFRAYWLSAAALIGGIFTAMAVVGILLGPVLPTGAGLQFTVPAMFLALLVGQLRDRPALVAAIAGAGVTALALDLPNGLGLMAGAVAGAAAGAITRRMS